MTRLPALGDRAVYVAVGILVVAIFVAGMAALDQAGVVDDVGIEPAFIAGFAIFVAIYFVAMYVSRYF